jgi:hypothetical protein
LNLLLELQQRLRLTLIFVAHDLSVVRHISDRVAVMYVGQIVELATTEAVFARPRHPYTAALMRAVGEVPSPVAPPSGCYFHPRCRFAEDRCRAEAPLLREVTPGHFARCHFAEQLSLRPRNRMRKKAPPFQFVIPAAAKRRARIHNSLKLLDSRFRGNDGWAGRGRLLTLLRFRLKPAAGAYDLWDEAPIPEGVGI